MKKILAILLSLLTLLSCGLLSACTPVSYTHLDVYKRQLYYRGISVEDIVDAHQQAGTFGYEEVAYLLLLGKLPTACLLYTSCRVCKGCAAGGSGHFDPDDCRKNLYCG